MGLAYSMFGARQNVGLMGKRNPLLDEGGTIPNKTGGANAAWRLI